MTVNYTKGVKRTKICTFTRNALILQFIALFSHSVYRYKKTINPAVNSFVFSLYIAISNARNYHDYHNVIMGVEHNDYDFKIEVWL